MFIDMFPKNEHYQKMRDLEKKYSHIIEEINQLYLKMKKPNLTKAELKLLNNEWQYFVCILYWKVEEVWRYGKESGFL